MLKTVIREICPPVLWKGLRSIKDQFTNGQPGTTPDHQNLGVYWDPKMAQALDTWGEKHVWQEIQLLLCGCRGRVLDIACGTGRTIEILSRFPALEVYGCDISDLLIQKAIARGIPKERARILDATKLDYEDDFFDYAYSIGSLEHFTEEGLLRCIAECYRVTRFASFHQMPTSRSGKDEGWTTTVQSFFNNSVDWWVNKFKSAYPTVHVVDSRWEDSLSVGKWFVGIRQRPGGT